MKAVVLLLTHILIAGSIGHMLRNMGHPNWAYNFFVTYPVVLLIILNLQEGRNGRP